MNDGNESSDGGEPSTAGGLGVDDVFFTLFRHKWLILTFVGLGLVAAVVVRLVKPPLYQSKAKLSVPYVVDTKAVNTANPDTQIINTGPGGMAVIESEIEILKSLDVCILVAESIGPERILAKKGGGNDRMAAAGMIASGILVDPPRTATISITFQHPDSEVVQPVLTALIDAYALKSLQVHGGGGVRDKLFIAKRDEWGKKLVETEAQLRRVMSDAKMISMTETKDSYQIEITKLQEKLFDAEVELAQRKAQLAAFDLTASLPGETNAVIVAMPADTLADYTATVDRLQYLLGYERQLLAQGKTEVHPAVQATRAERVERAEHKAALEQKYPSLVDYAVEPSEGINAVAAVGTTNSVRFVLAEVQRLTNNIHFFETRLSNVQFQVAQVMELEPKLTELQRQRNLQETNYQFYLGRIEQAQSGESSSENKMVNMAVIQSPSPPSPDVKKMFKLIGMALGGCIGLGIGLAFFIDLVIDRTLKRSTDVKRRLHLPVMLTIPHTNWSGGWCPAWLKRRVPVDIQRFDPKFNSEVPAGVAGVAQWNPVHHLRTYTDGLRERLITYFEVHNLTHHPKLVAVTSCGLNAGVTTLATGLAASLSMTGDGNVLLVDMNLGDGVTHSFHKGRPGYGLSEPDQDPVAAAANLYLTSVSADDNATSDQSKALPRVFTDVMPKLKVSGYDYIVFDMPIVSQTSLTPRLSGHMDMVLLVIESEKTSQHLAAESSALMHEAQAKVAAVLNKCKAHVPAAMSTGF